MGTIRKKKSTKGTNVRITDKGHKVIKAFVDKNGYNLGAFVEIAAMEKIQLEAVKNL